VGTLLLIPGTLRQATGIPLLIPGTLRQAMDTTPRIVDTPLQPTAIAHQATDIPLLIPGTLRQAMDTTPRIVDTPLQPTAIAHQGEGYSSPDSGYSSPSDGYESIPALLAFVNTVGHESDQDGIILSGEILRESDTNNDNIMVGFLLSTNIDLLLNDPFTQKVIGEFKNEGLFTGNFNSTLDGVIYYKAFAENEMGVSYGKVNKIAVIKSTNSQGQSPTEKAISTLGEDSIELPGGWNDNSWFGLYKVYENGWIYHSAHGWLYLSADSSDGIWAWSEKRSWVWSSKEIYPFLYQPSIGNWIYFLTSKNGQVYFFNYSTNLVEVNIP